MSPSNKCNGLTYDADLNLLVCEHVTSSLVRERPDGTRETIASHFEGKELNSPNDVCVHSSGAIFFSDPWYGRMPVFGEERERELGFQGVYRLVEGGEPELVVGRDDYEQPNGICFSPDESLFYVNDTPGAYIDVYDAAADGTPSNRRRFFSGVGSGVIEEGIPDGMKCDERGNVWVTGPGGIWVIERRRRASRRDRGAREHRQPDLGRRGLAHALHPVLDLALRHHDARRPAPRALHALRRRRCPTTRSPPTAARSSSRTCRTTSSSRAAPSPTPASPEHAKEQNVVENVKDLAAFCRGKGIPVIHVWYVVEEGAPGLKVNAPLFEGVAARRARPRHVGRRGRRRARGAGRRLRGREDAHERLAGHAAREPPRGLGRDTVIVTGAWTNMSIEHTSRTGADKGYYMVVPEDGCSTMNADWHRASIEYALQNVSTVTNCADVKAALR